MKKHVCYKSDNGSLHEHESYAAREDLRDLRAKIEHNWLPFAEHKTTDNFKSLVHIHRYLQSFKEDMDKYKEKFNKYQETYVNHIHYEDYDYEI